MYLPAKESLKPGQTNGNNYIEPAIDTEQEYIYLMEIF